MSAEAIRVPAIGAVFFTEASAASASGRPIPAPLPTLTARVTSALPVPLTWRADPRGIMLQAPGLRYDHIPDADERAQPIGAAPSISGDVRPLDGRYNPRAFSRVFSAGQRIAYVPLFPSPAAVRFGEAGGVALRLRYADGRAASWAVATLTCARNGNGFSFTGQADAAGDLALAFTGLPPLPAAAASDTLTLGVHADPAWAADAVADPDTLPARRIRLHDGDAFTDTVSFAFSRGRLLTARDLGTDAVTIEL